MGILLQLIAVAAIAILLILGFATVCMQLMELDRTRNLSDVDSRLATIQEQLYQLQDHLAFDSGMRDDDGSFHSMDGKYSANSLEELVKKMIDGGDVDLDPNDPDLLKKFFEELSDDEENDDDSKPWDKK